MLLPVGLAGNDLFYCRPIIWRECLDNTSRAVKYYDEVEK